MVTDRTSFQDNEAELKTRMSSVDITAEFGTKLHHTGLQSDFVFLVTRLQVFLPLWKPSTSLSSEQGGDLICFYYIMTGIAGFNCA